MKNLHLAQAFFFFVLFIASSTILSAQSASPAFFDVSTIDKMLNHRDCSGVRFYNVLKPGSDQVATMAIGVREDNSEIANFTNRYQLFAGVNAEGVEVNKLNQSKAAEACQKLKESGKSAFAATITKEDLTSLLNTDGAKGIIVQELKTESGVVYEAQAGTVTDGTIAPLQSSAAMRSGEPCPTFCGDVRNYIHM